MLSLLNIGGAGTDARETVNFALKSDGGAVENQDVHQLVDDDASTGRYQYAYRFIVNPADTNTHVYTIELNPGNADSDTKFHKITGIFEERETA